ncbi:hypothetical protein AA313_de0200705 [Arthrobotrys entomopaga]|nr:hypothetical protein AA313_de0200705 [Arthrobotrys entomopaga]
MTDQHHTSNTSKDNNNPATPPPPPPPGQGQHPPPLLPPLNSPVSFTGTPIPPARINHSISSGRPGPIVTIPVPTDLNGKPDYSRKPGLDLRHLVPRGVGNDTIENNSEVVEHSDSKSSNNNGELESSSIGDGFGKDNGCIDSHSPQNRIMTSLTHPENENNNNNNNNNLPETAAKEATSILSHKLPPELIPAILDEASYFPHKTIASLNETKSVSDGDKIYLVTYIPDFEAFDEGTRGKGGIGGGRQGKVRRLVFRMASRDQGWSSFRGDQGTYRGTWSWTEVELWRVGEKPKPLPLSESGPAMLEEDIEAEPKTQTQTDASGEEREEEEEEVIEESEEEREMNKGKYMVGSWLLQRNKHAESEPTHHEVVWDWKEDELDDDDDLKWEDNTIREYGGREYWQRGGKLANGAFIRQLEGGDEIRVVMKARYPGWRCEVHSCQIECFWAL